MPVRDTSRKAYFEVQAKGIESASKAKVYRALVEIGKAATYNEVSRVVADQGSLSQDNTAARIFDLRKDGLVREAGKRKCSVSGKTCLTWEPV